ncbi:MAG: hypothetical protein QN178_01060 [Armatimonadota bacterium]|nr:hypothetical protein [Armatimonadota bacterium]
MRRSWLEPLLVFILVLVVYVGVTPETNQAYKHFVYMALGFLDARVDLPRLPGWYHDVIYVQGRVYAPFPPVPAVLLLPVVALYGEATDQGRVGQIFAAGAVALFVAGLRRMGIGGAPRVFAATALAFGSVLWPATAIGTSWHYAQVVVVLACAWLLWELAGTGRPLVIGAAAVMAWLTRLSLLPAVPVLAALVWRRHPRPTSVAAFAAVNALGVAVYLLYNHLRFGHALQLGYPLLTMAAVNAEAYARYGFFNLHFVPEHLYAMFVRAPELIATPPFLKPSPHGMALIFTSPVIARLFYPEGGARGWWPWGALILSTAVPMLFYFSTGWVQFGYRYSLDWWVFVLVLLALAVGPRPKAGDYLLLALGIGANAVGVFWVRTLGW